MSGSDESGEEIQSGRTNRAENRTKIWAQRNEDEQFDGEAILVVESAFDIENDDFRQVSDTQDGYETRLGAFGRVSLQMGELNRSTSRFVPKAHSASMAASPAAPLRWSMRAVSSRSSANITRSPAVDHLHGRLLDRGGSVPKEIRIR